MQYVLAKMLFATKRLLLSPEFDPSILKNNMLHGDDEVRIEDPGPSIRTVDDLHEIAGNKVGDDFYLLITLTLQYTYLNRY